MKTLEQLRKEKYANHAAIQSGYFDSELKVKPPKTAAQLESLVSEYIALLGGICTIIYGGGRQVVKKTKVTDVLGRANTITDAKYIPSNVVKGHSDLIASYKGKTYYIEIKLNKDRQSQYQKDFEKYVTDRGAIYHIVKEISDVYQLFD